MVLINHLQDKIVLVESFCWRDGRAIFNTKMSHLHLLQNIGDSLENTSVLMCRTLTYWRLSVRIIWRKVWQDFRVEKINSFMWQIVFNALTTNPKYFQRVPRFDNRTHCKRCNRSIVEDICHYLVAYRGSARVWRWVKTILPILSFDPKYIQLSMTQILIGEPLEYHVPKQWSRSLWAAALWNIWLTRNQEVIAKMKVPFQAMKGRIWSQIRLDLKSKW